MKEDIKEIEIIITTIREILQKEIKDTTEDVYTIDGRQFKAIENLLTRYKEMKADNKRLKDKETEKFLKIIDDTSKATLVQETIKLRTQVKDSIPKSKVKEKIEELDKKEKEELKGMKGQDRYFVKQMYQTKRNILNVLLEGEN